MMCDFCDRQPVVLWRERETGGMICEDCMFENEGA